MDKNEALKLALEAYLCREMPAGTVIGDPKWWAPKIATAIKEALAQPPLPVQPEQEPVAWISAITGDWTMQDMSHTVSWAPLYTTPPQRPWVGLTDSDMPSKEIDAFCRGARWADEILKEKNT